MPRIASSTLLAAAGLALAGCNVGERLSDIGKAPDLSPIENPTRTATYRPVNMPMPAPQQTQQQLNSLWRPGARAFFKDQRAKVVGDILTVVVDLNDSAKINNTTERTRDAAEGATLNNLLGMEQLAERMIPGTWNPITAVDANAASKHAGNGQITRDEDIHENVDYDLYYVQHPSLTMDCVILILTVFSVVRGVGAH